MYGPSERLIIESDEQLEDDDELEDDDVEEC